MDGWMEGWMGGWMDRWMDGWWDGGMVGRMDESNTNIELTNLKPTLHLSCCFRQHTCDSSTEYFSRLPRLSIVACRCKHTRTPRAVTADVTLCHIIAFFQC